MARLVLKFDSSVLRDFPLANRPVTIGRAADNDIAIDNLAVSAYHAKVYTEAGRIVLEDLNTLNGTFVNDLRVERGTLKDGDTIQVGKHRIEVDLNHEAALSVNGSRKTANPRLDETMVLDTKARRVMLEQAVAVGERSQMAPARLRIPTLTVLSGRTDRNEYMLSDKLTVIGRSQMASIRLIGWFAPKVAAQISKRDDGYFLGVGDRVPKINGIAIICATRLQDGDLIDIGRVRLQFAYRD